MKKALLIIASVLGFAAVASAQPKAIGGRLGYGIEASYQHYLGNPNFLEVDAGLLVYGGEAGFQATGTYNFTFAQPTHSGYLSSFQQIFARHSESATVNSGQTDFSDSFRRSV